MKKVKDKKKSKSKYKLKPSQLKDISKTQKRTKKVSNKKKVQSASKIKLKKMIKEAVNEAINELNTKDKEDNKKSKKIKVTVKSNNSNKYFVLEVELTPSKKMKKVINAIFKAARHVYNAVLGESLKRMRFMKDSKEYQNARNMPKGLEKVHTFQELNKKFQFTEYDMHSYVKIVLDSWLGEYVKSQLGQVLATRAFRAVYKMCIGKAKKVRFKNKTSIGSIEQKSNTTGFMWKDKQKSVVYQGEQIDINYDLKDSYIVYQLTRTGDVKYCRIIRRNIRGKVRYFVQLIAKGRPLDFDEKQALRDKDYLKTEEKNTSHDIVGLDIGPSTIAIVSEKEARLVQFCDELEDKSAEIRVLNRSIDRKRIAANPDNYDEKGRIKKGKKSWKKSKNQKNEERKRAEIQRKQAAH